MKALLIAEKPSLAREIANTYHKMTTFPDNIEITNFAGHVVGLKNPRDYGVYNGKDWAEKKWNWGMLPIMPDKFLYKVSDDKTKMYNDLKNQIDLGNYDYIINACDPDREGNHIFQLFYDLSGCTLPIKRFWTNDLTESSIKYALEHLRYEGDGEKPDLKYLTEAATLRAQFDWLCGMNFTVASSLQMKQTAKIGRVKTPTLCILAKREEELANFKPVTTYELEAIYKEGFTGVLFDEEGNVRFAKEEDSTDILSKLNPNKAIVESVETKREKTNAPQLYKLSDLQVDASKYFGYNADKVLELAQTLYEKKLLSYPRTDCRYIGKALTSSFPKLLDTISSLKEIEAEARGITKAEMDKVAKSSRYVNDAELKKSGHYALMPTVNKADFTKLPTDEANILTLVYKRFLALFLPPMEADKTTIITDNNGFKFKTNGKVLIDKGWTRIYKTSSTDTLLPEVKKGQEVNIDMFQLAEKVSTPPPRYTEGALISAMENPAKFLSDDSLKTIIKEKQGIGTPATRAAIISQLISDGYIVKKKGKGKAELIYVEPKGMLIYNNVKTKDFSSVDMTGTWEKKLSDVEQGIMSRNDFDKEMREYVLKSIDDIKGSSMKTSGFSTTAKSIGKCPKCSGNVLVGKNYYLCEHYKDTCDFIIGKNILGANISETECKKLLEGKETKELIFKKDNDSWKTKLVIRDGKVEFVGKGNNSASSESKTITCPDCGGVVTINKYGAFCRNKDIKLSRTLKGTTLTDDQLIALINGETIEENFTWSNGKTSKAKVKLKDGVPNFSF